MTTFVESLNATEYQITFFGNARLRKGVGKRSLPTKQTSKSSEITSVGDAGAPTNTQTGGRYRLMQYIETLTIPPSRASATAVSHVQPPDHSTPALLIGLRTLHTSCTP
uniref:RxLR effector candidate protein n=1 Tax=Hyaloperonospora arabidopsidis (strain Emoy2) TaxID=559515 RepID=M4BC69_HYAAE